MLMKLKTNKKKEVNLSSIYPILNINYQEEKLAGFNDEIYEDFKDMLHAKNPRWEEILEKIDKIFLECDLPDGTNVEGTYAQKETNEALSHLFNSWSWQCHKETNNDAIIGKKLQIQFCVDFFFCAFLGFSPHTNIKTELRKVKKF